MTPRQFLRKKKKFKRKLLTKMNANRRLVQERQQRRERKRLAKLARKKAKEKSSKKENIILTIKENLLTKRNSTEELPEIKFKIKMKTPMGKVFDCYAKKYVRDAIFL